MKATETFIGAVAIIMKTFRDSRKGVKDIFIILIQDFLTLNGIHLGHKYVAISYKNA